MKIAGYEFAEGARFQPGADATDPKAVGKRLEMLRKQCKGELTPEDVLKDAKDRSSPLHGFFEWSDTKAAHQHRLAQARGLIRSVVAIYVSDTEPAVRQRAYVHIPEAGAPHYRDTAQALSQTKTRKLVLQRAWTELQFWKKKYRDLSEFAAVVEVIDETGNKIRTKIGR